MMSDRNIPPYSHKRRTTQSVNYRYSGEIDEFDSFYSVRDTDLRALQTVNR